MGVGDCDGCERYQFALLVRAFCDCLFLLRFSVTKGMHHMTEYPAEIRTGRADSVL